jgi:curved DNA-binding protein
MNLYELLEIDRTADNATIKSAYRRLANTYHPDKPTGDADKFKKIKKAYETLSDSKKRAEYDNPQIRFRSPFGRPSNVEDVFSQFFNQSKPRSNQPVTINISVSLEEVLVGKDVIGDLHLPSGRDQALTIKIPPGVSHGDVVKYLGMGDDSIPHMPRGDLMVAIQQEPHPIFQRKGEHLLMDHSISVFDAMLGTKIQITTLEGKMLDITVPAGTDSGKIFSCAGYGLPRKNSPDRGNLHIKINVKMPSKLTLDTINLLKPLQKQYQLS